MGSVGLCTTYLRQRFPQSQKDFLDNSSGGSFTNNITEDAWDLLDKISGNTDNWDLDKGNIPGLEYEYTCVEKFHSSPLFSELVISLVLIPMF